MNLLLRWRIPERPIVTRWRGPEGMAQALERDPSLPIAAIIGPPGPSGSVGSGAVPQRIDASLAATWILPHSLGRMPMVQVFLTASGSGGEQAIADITADAATVTVTHASPQTGFILAY